METTALSPDLGLPIESRPMTDAPGFAELYGTGAAGAVLLRPDGHVAWRSAKGPDRDADAMLARAVDTAMGKHVAVA